MPTKDELLKENRILRERLVLAQEFMRKQIDESVRLIVRERLTKSTRKHMENMFETDIVDSLAKRIQEYFGDALLTSPAHTIERLIDSEIYYFTLQKYPTMDAFPVINAYHKILESFFEMITVSLSPPQLALSLEKGLGGDIANIWRKKYSLSLGRWYQFLKILRFQEDEENMVSHLHKALEEKYPNLLSLLLSDSFFLPFEGLTEREIFSRKRHDAKVNFRDATDARMILTGNYLHTGIFKILFQSI